MKKPFNMTGGKGLKMQWGYTNSKDPKAMDWDKVFKNTRKTSNKNKLIN